MQTPQNTKSNLPASLIKVAAANLAIQALGKNYFRFKTPSLNLTNLITLINTI